MGATAPLVVEPLVVLAIATTAEARCARAGRAAPKAAAEDTLLDSIAADIMGDWQKVLRAAAAGRGWSLQRALA